MQRGEAVVDSQPVGSQEGDEVLSSMLASPGASAAPLQPVPFTPALSARSEVGQVRSVSQPGSMSWPHGFSRRASEEVTVDASEQAGDVRSRILSSASMQSAMNRARSIDSDRGVDIKRSASQKLDKPEGDASAGVEVEGPPGDSQALEANPAFEAMTMTWEHLCNLAENVAVHPPCCKSKPRPGWIGVLL